MKPTERHTVTVFFPGNKQPLVFVAFIQDILDREIKSLKEMGFDEPTIKSEKIP